MIFKTYLKALNDTILCLFILSLPVKSQTYQFRNYGKESKIPDGFIYTVNQDNKGYLWVGTRKGISKFDGFDFHNVEFPDSAGGRYPTACLKDRTGKLWFGCSDGTLFFTEENELKPLEINNNKSISSVVEAPDGAIWIVPQADAVFRINPSGNNDPRSFSVDQDKMLFSASFTGSGDILLGTQENIQIMRIQDDSLIVHDTIQGFNYSNVTAIQKLQNSDYFLAGTNGSGLFLLNLSGNSKELKRLSGSEELAYLDVQSIFQDSDNYSWVSTNGSGILRLKTSPSGTEVINWGFIDSKTGLPANNIRTVFRDVEGNYWIGYFGEGLSMLPSMALAFYSPGNIPEANNIIYVNKLNKDYILGTPTGYYIFDIENNSTRSFTDLRRSTGNNEITAYYADKNGSLWIGTGGGGLFLKGFSGPVRQFYRTDNSSEDYILNIHVSNEFIWLGTLNGVIILDSKTGTLRGRYNTNNGLPHNRIDQICLLSDGTASVATQTDRIYIIDPLKGVSSGNAIMRGPTMNVISSCCQSRDGNIWVATTGNGIFEFSGDSLTSYTRADMLMTDYCYSILADSLDRIWIGHDRGISRYDRSTGVMKTYGTDFAKGGICNPAAIFEAPGGRILIGTSQGLIVYDTGKEQKTHQPPVSNINSVSINDVVYPFRNSFTLPYNKKYKIVINYVGISLRDPERVYYQTMLENWDDDWTDWNTDREVLISPRDGKYRFIMNSINAEGFSGEPVSFDLVIRTPFWRTWWFFLLVASAVTGIVILIIRQREKAQKKIELYLKTELEARTREVVKQKGEIEIKNIEITDSISYAKRIQTSILPDINKLRETFSDAFILFKPRDIVSGDFYWFDRAGDDKFMLVCADSTGHGVPGAFMSMIGSTLLQDIISRQHITRPSEILKTLDKQLFSTLNQNIELGVSNDGMDMVVCEIGIKTRHIRFASAMRPVIIVLEGESLYVKGNRSSIGGETTNEKFFDDQEYFMKEGDSLYLFTDGLPDQFGSGDGKKMKVARLKTLLEEIKTFSMDEQKNRINKFFEDWKGDTDQVDDILMMGIRF
ncbi:MAG TPA: two-component regulator propeller domain-containing protein [Bacteroidales bacterium]|nr:two-component regulator propeller domain-containing protein [Bacteroidales bacterium]